MTPDPWQEDVLKAWLGVRPDGTWAATRCGLAAPRQNGKNGILEMRELFGMVGLRERFLHTAHEVKTCRKAFLRLASFFENERHYPELAALVKEIRKTNGQEAIILSNGGSVEFIARSKGSGRGFSADVLVLDEAQELGVEALAALLPTISVSPNPQRILTGTPPGPKMNGEVFARVRRRGVAGTDPRAAWIDYGCEGQLPDVDDRAGWARHNPALGGRLRAETIVDERALMDEETFARERLGWWGDPDVKTRTRVDLRRWVDMTDERAEFTEPYKVCLSVEVSRDQEWSTIGVCGASTGGDLLLVRSGRGTDWVADEVARLVEKHDPIEIALDPAGRAGALLPDLAAAGLEVVTLSSRDMQQACGGFQNGVMAGRFVHLGQRELAVAVRTAVTREVGDAEVWDRREGGPDISPLVAVSIAAYSYARKSDDDYNVLDSVA